MWCRNLLLSYILSWLSRDGILGLRGFHCRTSAQQLHLCRFGLVPEQTPAGSLIWQRFTNESHLPFTNRCLKPESRVCRLRSDAQLQDCKSFFSHCHFINQINWWENIFKLLWSSDFMQSRDSFCALPKCWQREACPSQGCSPGDTQVHGVLVQSEQRILTSPSFVDQRATIKPLSGEQTLFCLSWSHIGTMMSFFPSRWSRDHEWGNIIRCSVLFNPPQFNRTKCTGPEDVVDLHLCGLCSFNVLTHCNFIHAALVDKQTALQASFSVETGAFCSNALL